MCGDSNHGLTRISTDKRCFERDLSANRITEGNLTVEDIREDPWKSEVEWFLYHLCLSLIISLAAFAPDPPVSPIPGCVPEPHKYRFLIGVRYCAQLSSGRMVNN